MRRPNSRVVVAPLITTTGRVASRRTSHRNQGEDAKERTLLGLIGSVGATCTWHLLCSPLFSLRVAIAKGSACQRPGSFSRRRALSLTIRTFSSGAMESESRENARTQSLFTKWEIPRSLDGTTESHLSQKPFLRSPCTFITQPKDR
jgi:hypothetical protein